MIDKLLWDSYTSFYINFLIHVPVFQDYIYGSLCSYRPVLSREGPLLSQALIVYICSLGADGKGHC